VVLVAGSTVVQQTTQITGEVLVQTLTVQMSSSSAWWQFWRRNSKHRSRLNPLPTRLHNTRS